MLALIDKVPLLKGFLANKLNSGAKYVINYLLEMFENKTGTNIVTILESITKGFGQHML